jgi:hypothetical protein
MTWNELRKFIDGLDPAWRNAEVRFVETYDKGRDGYYVQAGFASEDRTIGGDDEPEVVFVQRGHPFLW